MREHSNVVNEQDLEWGEQSHGEKIGYRRKQLSSVAGGEKLGCTLRGAAGAQSVALPLPPR